MKNALKFLEDLDKSIAEMQATLKLAEISKRNYAPLYVEPQEMKAAAEKALAAGTTLRRLVYQRRAFARSLNQSYLAAPVWSDSGCPTTQDRAPAAFTQLDPVQPRSPARSVLRLEAFPINNRRQPNNRKQLQKN